MSLSEFEWTRVFEIRCRSKRGQPITEDERDLIASAYENDPKRFAGMTADVFDATVPLGSTAKFKR